MKKLCSSIIGSFSAAFAILCLVSIIAYAAVTQVSGLAVAQSATRWNNVKDAAIGDAQTNGIAAFNCYLYNGTNFDRCRGSITGGLLVQQAQVGTAFFAVKRDNIAGSSVNLAYGFTSRKVALEFPLTNTDEVCVDWLGGTAVCPAANTSGDDRFAPGSSIIIDDYAGTSISVISASGTQTVYVRAWQ